MGPNKFLIAEDFLLIRTLLRNVLTELGFNDIDEAKDGLEAYQKIAKAYLDRAPFTFVFIDWNMPKMSGIEVVEKCLVQPELKALSFVMITAEREEEKVKRAIKAGVKDLIVKPFSTATIKDKVAKILAGEVGQKPA